MQQSGQRTVGIYRAIATVIPASMRPERFPSGGVVGQLFHQEISMRKTVLAAICAAAITSTSFAALAQSTGPTGQDTTKMGTAPMSKDGESKTTGTQGMSKDSMSKDAMKKDSMGKDEMKK